MFSRELWSSCGIMNAQFQDLQVTLQSRIFSLLSSQERQQLRLVCPTWKHIIDQEFGLRIIANNGSTDVLQSSCLFVKELELNSLTIPIRSLNLTFSPKLSTLRLYNIVVAYNLVPLLQQCAHSLTTLSFSHIVLDLPQQLTTLGENSNYFSENSSKPPLVLKNLQNLELNEWNYSDSLSALLDMFNNRVAFGNLKKLSVIMQTPPTLPLQLLYQTDEQMNLGTVPSFILILKNNIHSIETFKYGRPVANISLKFYPFGMIPGRGVHPIQIEELLVQSQFKSEWVPVLVHQKRLVKFHIGDCRVGMWEAIKNCVRDNSETLETFWIGGQSFNQDWDLNAFFHCRKLRKLSVQLYMSPKINLHCAPWSLTHINLSGPIKRFELLELSQRLLNCQEAEFSHLGVNQIIDVSDDHLSLEVFLKLVQMPKLVRLSLAHCDWNEVDWENVIQWCNNHITQGITFEQLFYPLHGQDLRHGLNLNILQTFDRRLVEQALADQQHQLVQESHSSSYGVCNTVYELLTSWL